MLGGRADRALERAGGRADAWLSAPAAPDDIVDSYAKVRATADKAGRPAPRLLASADFAIGDVDDEVNGLADLVGLYPRRALPAVSNDHDGHLTPLPFPSTWRAARRTIPPP